ncbi:hypothetical protein BDV41DRAFT_141297 [Aspergillus transmontanensis]|uniref:Uncharacterized protein n=1 Tax=Aspergillus transmontanensis TaxID=1034304 RepID=A0A5N6W4Y6_9EURO|nr:hypothetical protein BDV41DRAFT_141297 [Aspergillus transmontanensis]
MHAVLVESCLTWIVKIFLKLTLWISATTVYTLWTWDQTELLEVDRSFGVELFQHQ